MKPRPRGWLFLAAHSWRHGRKRRSGLEEESRPARDEAPSFHEANQGESNLIKPKNMEETKDTPITPILPIDPIPALTPEQQKIEEENRLWCIAHHFE